MRHAFAAGLQRVVASTPCILCGVLHEHHDDNIQTTKRRKPRRKPLTDDAVEALARKIVRAGVDSSNEIGESDDPDYVERVDGGAWVSLRIWVGLDDDERGPVSR